MENKKNYTNLSIAGVLFLMTGYVIEKFIKLDPIISIVCYMLAIICLLISILKNNKQKRLEREANNKKK